MRSYIHHIKENEFLLITRVNLANPRSITCEDLPSGSWSFINDANKMTEEQIEMMVERFYSIVLRIPRYKDYLYNTSCFTRRESFNSLLRKLDMDPNETVVFKKE